MSRSKALARNRKARHDFEIIEKFEAGLVLQGTEIKSIRAGRINIQDGFVSFYNNEAWLKNVHISPYEEGNRFNHDPLRDRKLLLHRRQIDYLYNEFRQKSYTIVPLEVYLVNGRAKVQIGLAKGKTNVDRRHDLKERQMKRDIERALSGRR